jgi:hypothetical protein
MTEDNVTKASKAQTIKALSAFNDRYEAIDVVEEGNYKTQSQLRKAIYMHHTLISSLPHPSQIERRGRGQRYIIEAKTRSSRFQKRHRNALRPLMHVTNRRMSSGF